VSLADGLPPSIVVVAYGSAPRRVEDVVAVQAIQNQVLHRRLLMASRLFRDTVPVPAATPNVSLAAVPYIARFAAPWPSTVSSPQRQF